MVLIQASLLQAMLPLLHTQQMLYKHLIVRTVHSSSPLHHKHTAGSHMQQQAEQQQQQQQQHLQAVQASCCSAL
jgi:multidrug resistance efflux pump